MIHQRPSIIEHTMLTENAVDVDACLSLISGRTLPHRQLPAAAEKHQTLNTNI
jgi:hypothetical protein